MFALYFSFQNSYPPKDKKSDVKTLKTFNFRPQSTVLNFFFVIKQNATRTVIAAVRRWFMYLLKYLLFSQVSLSTLTMWFLCKKFIHRKKVNRWQDNWSVDNALWPYQLPKLFTLLVGRALVKIFGLWCTMISTKGK